MRYQRHCMALGKHLQTCDLESRLLTRSGENTGPYSHSIPGKTQGGFANCSLLSLVKYGSYTPLNSKS